MLTVFVLAIGLNFCSVDDLGCRQNSSCQVSGFSIGDVEGVSYGLSQYCDGKRHKFVFEARPSQSRGTTEWHEIDKMYIGTGDKALIIASDGLCRIHGKRDPEIFAMVRPDDVQYWRAIKAWRADRKQRKIVRVSARGVDCENEGYGA